MSSLGGTLPVNLCTGCVRVCVHSCLYWCQYAKHGLVAHQCCIVTIHTGMDGLEDCFCKLTAVVLHRISCRHANTCIYLRSRRWARTRPSLCWRVTLSLSLSSLLSLSPLSTLSLCLLICRAMFTCHRNCVFVCSVFSRGCEHNRL